eukprot:322707-Rhodomonas_salina.1
MGSETWGGGDEREDLALLRGRVGVRRVACGGRDQCQNGGSQERACGGRTREDVGQLDQAVRVSGEHPAVGAVRVVMQREAAGASAQDGPTAPVRHVGEPH